MRLSAVTVAVLLASHGCANPIAPRDFFSSLVSLFGGDDGPATPTPQGRPTPAPPATPSKASAVPTTQKSILNPSPTSSSISIPSSTSTNTKTNTATSTSTSTITSTITSSATLSTTTTTPVPSSIPLNPQPQATKSNSISPAGIAVAVIFSILIALVIAWVVFRYHPKCRAWWLARQEEKYKERSYRDGLEGGLTRGRTGLQSFFQARPKSLHAMPSIKRKTIHWGAPAPTSTSTKGLSPTPPVPFSPHEINTSGEKVPLAELASPMGTYPPTIMRSTSPLNSAHSPISAMSPVSPMSASASSSTLRAGSTRSNTNTNMYTNTNTNRSRESKALPQVKVNGQVIYELA